MLAALARPPSPAAAIGVVHAQETDGVHHMWRPRPPIELAASPRGVPSPGPLLGLASYSRAAGWIAMKRARGAAWPASCWWPVAPPGTAAGGSSRCRQDGAAPSPGGSRPTPDAVASPRGRRRLPHPVSGPAGPKDASIYVPQFARPGLTWQLCDVGLPNATACLRPAFCSYFPSRRSLPGSYRNSQEEEAHDRVMELQ